MKNRNKTIVSMVCAAILLFLIFDTQTALYGAKEGISICIQVVIPSLFPFLFLSGLLTAGLQGHRIHFGRIGRILGIPENAEILFILGLLGGYPVGANCITQAYKNGTISKSDGERMLGFCNNAGPAFIFGMSAGIFQDHTTGWKLWIIQILSAFLTGCILPEKSKRSGGLTKASAEYSIRNAINAMANICGWIIIFRVLICILSRWILWFVPESIRPLIIGILELTNGCIALNALPSKTLQIICMSGMLTLGGLCVWMQTASVTADLRIHYYIIGKLIQTALSVMLAAIIVYFPGNPIALVCIGIGFSAILCLYCNRSEKNTGNYQKNHV